MPLGSVKGGLKLGDNLYMSMKRYNVKYEDKINKIQILQIYAKSKHGICLSSPFSYKNAHSKIVFMCLANHIFESSYHNMTRQLSWCLECQGRKKRNIEAAKEYAQNRGGECISEKYINNKSNLIFRCAANKHIFKSSLHRLLTQDSWCPFCGYRHSKGEIELYNIIKTRYIDAINGARVLPNKRYELDIYIPSLHKAIEYDGRAFHGPNALYNSNALERDFYKDKWCRELGISLLRISEDEYNANKSLFIEEIFDWLGQ